MCFSFIVEVNKCKYYRYMRKVVKIFQSHLIYNISDLCGTGAMNIILSTSSSIFTEDLLFLPKFFTSKFKNAHIINDDLNYQGIAVSMILMSAVVNNY